MIDFPGNTVSWALSETLVPYPAAVTEMEQRAAAIRAGKAREAIWLLEHPPLYTAGTSAVERDLRDPQRFPVFSSGRGGQFTYHGPGQRIAYVMLNVHRRFGTDVRAFVETLERWVIEALDMLNIVGDVRPGRVGVWVDDPRRDGGERKIAAIGIRIRHGVSYHGISLNVDPDLTHYDGIVPCGIADRGVTSLADLGNAASMKDVDMCLRKSFERTFGVQTENETLPATGLNTPVSSA